MLGREHSGIVSKKFIGTFKFWGITLNTPTTNGVWSPNYMSLSTVTEDWTLRGDGQGSCKFCWPSLSAFQFADDYYCFRVLGISWYIPAQDLNKLFSHRTFFKEWNIFLQCYNSFTKLEFKSNFATASEKWDTVYGPDCKKRESTEVVQQKMHQSFVYKVI